MINSVFNLFYTFFYAVVECLFFCANIFFSLLSSSYNRFTFHSLRHLLNKLFLYLRIAARASRHNGDDAMKVAGSRSPFVISFRRQLDKQWIKDVYIIMYNETYFHRWWQFNRLIDYPRDVIMWDNLRQARSKDSRQTTKLNDSINNPSCSVDLFSSEECGDFVMTMIMMMMNRDCRLQLSEAVECLGRKLYRHHGDEESAWDKFKSQLCRCSAALLSRRSLIWWCCWLWQLRNFLSAHFSLKMSIETMTKLFRPAETLNP